MENDSKYEHSQPLGAISIALGITSGLLLLAAAGFLLVSVPPVPQAEFDIKIRKMFIIGGIFAAAALFVGVAGCIPLPDFVSKRIAASGLPDKDELDNTPLESISHQVSAVAITNFR